MVREAYSAGGQPQQADGDAAAQPLDLHSSTASLTQELSQLLAASIAQGQAGKRAAGPVSAGSELANLQALVSASQSQRTPQPTFRDGLSSLSYARPAQPPMPPPPTPAPTPAIMPPPAVTGGGLLVAEPHDEEPMPIPSTWRQPMPSDDERWYRQQLGAAGLGLVAGLVVVVPAVLWLSGWLGGPQTKPVARNQSAPETAPVKIAEVQPVKVRIATASAEARIPEAPEPRATVAPQPVAPAATSSRARSIAEPAAPVVQAPPPVVAAVAPRPEPPPPAPVRSRADELLTQAKRLIEDKDIVGAREVLQVSENVLVRVSDVHAGGDLRPQHVGHLAGQARRHHGQPRACPRPVREGARPGRLQGSAKARVAQIAALPLQHVNRLSIIPRSQTAPGKVVLWIADACSPASERSGSVCRAGTGHHAILAISTFIVSSAVDLLAGGAATAVVSPPGPVFQPPQPRSGTGRPEHGSAGRRP